MEDNQQKGFSLLEIMIALLVISVGALGFTKAQFSAVQNASDAGLRTTATILIKDMSARIQANSGEALQGLSSGYVKGPATTNYNCLGGAPGSGNICTGNQTAMHDLAEWQELINNAFPANSSAVGLVCLENPPGNTSSTCKTASSNPNPIVYTVKIFWKSWQSRGSGGGLDQSVISTIQPPVDRANVTLGGGISPGIAMPP